MSWQAAGYAKEVCCGTGGERITHAEKLLLLLIADYHNTETDEAWPSVGRLAKEALLEERSVTRCLVALETKGLISIQRRFDDLGRQLSNGYRLPALSPHPDRQMPLTGQSPTPDPGVSLEGDRSVTQTSKKEPLREPITTHTLRARENNIEKNVRHSWVTWEDVPEDVRDVLDREYGARLRATGHTLGPHVDDALNHTARSKALDTVRYLKTWLRRDCERVETPPKRGNGHAPPPVGAKFAGYVDQEAAGG